MRRTATLLCLLTLSALCPGLGCGPRWRWSIYTPGSLRVTVRDATTNRSLEGATVSIVPSDTWELPQAEQTESGGVARFHLRPGECSINKVEAAGYLSRHHLSQALVIRSHRTEHIKVALYPASLVGRALPKLSAFAIGFKPQYITGKRLLLCFWDIEQSSSRRFLRQLARQSGELAERNIRTVTIHTGTPRPEHIRRWLVQNRIPFPTGSLPPGVHFWSQHEVLRPWEGIRGLPWLILTDDQHVVGAEGLQLHDIEERFTKTGFPHPHGGRSDSRWLRYAFAHVHDVHELLGLQRHVVGDRSGARIEAQVEPPAQVGLPKFISATPVFGKWITPRVRQGHLWAAVERTRKDGPYDRLFIDTNGDGSLADEDAVTALVYPRGKGPSSFFLARVLLEGEGGRTTYHLSVSVKNKLQKGLPFAFMWAQSAAWNEGAVVIDGEAYDCKVVDYNANGAFNDRSIDSRACDRIDLGNGRFSARLHVGEYVRIGDKHYRLRVSRDGASVRFVRAKTVRMGAVRMPKAITYFSAGGVNGLFCFDRVDGVVRMPVGEYRIKEWRIRRKDRTGVDWEAIARGYVSAKVFEVKEGQDTVLSIGEPIIGRIWKSKAGNVYKLWRSLVGRIGARVILRRDGRRPRAPHVVIENAEGTYKRRFSFEYG